MASFRALTQKLASNVFDKRHANTFRVARSVIAINRDGYILARCPNLPDHFNSKGAVRLLKEGRSQKQDAG